MADYQTHCVSCRRKIGKSCEEVHRWMDEPVKMMGKGHRVYRHDINRTPGLAEEIWNRKYKQGLTNITGDEAKEACIDHILLDKEKGDLPPEPELPLGIGVSFLYFPFYIMWLVMTSDSLFAGTFIFYNFIWLSFYAVIAGFTWGSGAVSFLPAFLYFALGFIFKVSWMVGLGTLGLFMTFMVGLADSNKQKCVFTKWECIFIHFLGIVAAILGGWLALNKTPWIILLVLLFLSLILSSKAFEEKEITIESRPEGSEKQPPKREKVYHCITCGAEISEDEYEENEGQCDNCVAEDTVYAGHFPELGFE